MSSKISRPKKFEMQKQNDRVTKDLKDLPKASGLEFHSKSQSITSEAIDMSDYLQKGEFEQYEKRIDERINHLNSKIDALPELFADKLEIALGKRAEDERKERKDDKKAIIGWSISGTSLIIAFLGILGKAFGWF